MENKLKELKIKRDSKFGVGKKMGSQLWIHKDYILDILDVEEYNKFKSEIPEDFNFEILRWDSKLNELAFIECNDFNTTNEPIVGQVKRVVKNNLDFELLKSMNPPKDPLIYHHKWTFVKDDYKGFDVKESKLRSIEWKEKLGIDRSTSSKIGRLSFWDKWLTEKGLLPRSIDKNIESVINELNNKDNKMDLEKIINNKLNTKEEWLEDIPEEWLFYVNSNLSRQKITSENTSRNQLPKTLKVIEQLKLGKENPVLLDLGCGKDNTNFKSSLESEGVKYFGCDPFNQEKFVNLESIYNCKNGGADLVLINNVLNAMSQKEIRQSILEQASNAINKDSGMVFILTYEGELTSKEKAAGLSKKDMQPRETKDGWQNRQKTEFYLDEVKSIFPNVEIMTVASAKLIVASKNPSLDLDLKGKLKEIQKRETKSRFKP